MTKKNRNSCETCALTASLPQAEQEDDLRGEKIYAEFLRRNKKSRRISDVGGPDAKTLFCALGSRHFKNGGTKCKHWIPALDFTISDALSIHLSRKMTWLTDIIIALTITMLILMAYSILKEPRYTIEVMRKNVPTAIDDNRHDQSKETVSTENSKNNNKKPKSNIEQPKPKTVIPAGENHNKPPKPLTNRSSGSAEKGSAAH